MMTVSVDRIHRGRFGRVDERELMCVFAMDSVDSARGRPCCSCYFSRCRQ